MALAEQVTHTIRNDARSEPFALSDWFDEWLASGKAVEEVGGDYALFLRVFAFVAARFAEKPEDYGDSRLRITGVISLDVDGSPPGCLDQDHWRLFAFRRMYGSKP